MTEPTTMRRFWAIKHPHLDLFLSRGPVTSGGMQRWEKDEREAKEFPSEPWAQDVIDLILNGLGIPVHCTVPA